MPAPLDLFLKRRSPYSFAAEPVPADVLDSMFEAARWAPSYGNRQPWRFVVARTPDVLERLRDTLTRGNQYARAAPVLLVLAADPADAQIRDGREYYLLDCGLALENLLLQATAQGLHAHPMGGFDEAGARAALAMPEQVRVVALIAIGYPGNPADLDESTRERDERERTRKPLEQVRVFDRWEPVP